MNRNYFAIALTWSLLGLALALLWQPVGSSITGIETPEPDVSVFIPIVVRSVPDIPPLVILDKEGVEQDWDWLRQRFGGVEVTRAPAGAAYRACVLKEAWPDATLVVWVTEDGTPLQGITVIRYWPDAPFLPPELVGWYNRGVYGPTKETGEIGFGMGGGDYYFPPAAGASAVWVGDPEYPSDLVSGLGMLGGTNHIHLDVEYCLYR